MKRSTLPSGPLSRRHDVAATREGGTDVLVEATEAERHALAADLGLPGIDRLRGEYRIRREGAAGLRVVGTVTGRVRQICVVSLDDFASDIAEAVDVAYAPEFEVEALATARAARPTEADADEVEDLPDSILNGRIDLGALTAEMLALSLDPHPRKPGVSFAAPADAGESTAPEASPFAALRRIEGSD